MSADAPVLPDGFDLEALLAPIDGDTPQGVDLREDYSAQSPYFRLRDARSEAREAERRAESMGDDAEGGVPQAWRTVYSIGTQAIAERSKDLEVAAWITEAMLRQHGLPGLAAGALLIQGLAERYWDGLYPLPDEDGIATRVSPVTGLSGADADGTLMAALRRLPLFNRPDGSPFGWWEYERSVELAGIVDNDRRQQRINGGTLPMEEVEGLARAAGAAHFGRLRRTLQGTIDAWAGMAQTLDNLAGYDGPSTGRVRDLLQSMQEVVARFAPAEDGAEPEAIADAVGESGGGAVAVASGGGGGRPAGPAPRSREDYLRLLIEIADYFRQTEPHSPLSYTLQDAVRRARMTLPELLAELVPDESSRAQILNTLGIRPPQDNSYG